MLNYRVSPRSRMARRHAHMVDANRPNVHIPVDVIVEGDDYLISALIPGVTAEDVQIEVLEDVVSISGDFPVIETEEEVHYLRRERPTGTFGRTMRLPSTLNAAGAEAEFSNGVLNLRVPKAEEAKAKHIKVKAK